MELTLREFVTTILVAAGIIIAILWSADLIFTYLRARNFLRRHRQCPLCRYEFYDEKNAESSKCPECQSVTLRNY